MVKDKGQKLSHLHNPLSIDIFEEDGFCSPDIIAEPIRTRISVYQTREERDGPLAAAAASTSSCHTNKQPTPPDSACQRLPIRYAFISRCLFARATDEICLGGWAFSLR